MTSPYDEPTDRKVDQQLLRWHDRLQCDDSQRKRMQARFLEQLSVEQNSQDSIELATSESKVNSTSTANRRFWRNPTLFVTTAAMVLLAVGYWQFLPYRESRPKDATSELGQVTSCAFSPDDIHRTEQLYCELDRVFEHKVPVIRQCGDRVDFDFATHDLTVQSKTPIILRFVLQERVNGDNWTTLHSEDIIGSNDQQFTLPKHSGIVVNYWSHLLPDRSLWVEVTVTDSTSSTQPSQPSEQHCLSNDPKVVWTEKRDNKSLQLVLAFEQLKPCEPGVL